MAANPESLTPEGLETLLAEADEITALFRSSPDYIIPRMAAALRTLSATVDAKEAEALELRDACAELVIAVTAEVNEKGGGGFVLARLSDAKDVLFR